ncbi:MAG TPA: LysR family transcriptional regulator [Casimicrobium huifangae]|jgi:DNA-binding transcriptional LysR family regulator|uniref:LysR family transcriptional regulator n=1 Tax=Casimicrobium huifangae TaxID=2591109 RepID=UPI0012EC9626|nr:LysR family transcriptional regulator [Casimicrobium huifangae]HOB01758.1 LysR family transcriptional regulator [Casimicrobium huifangae]HQA33887.1 LysR family transcriptional regulator [Casimicrobium huifangae]HQD64185.1 LysR family transcriptional regulator [Casimicrobium huifangae]
MNLRFVEAFYWVATLKSVSRAAEKLFITQSAMSARVAALEDELGALLLDRRDKTFRLTVAGSRFLVHAQKLLELQRTAKAEVGSELAPEMTVRLGAIESVLHSWLIPWVEALRQQYPSLELELTVETTPVLIDQMRRGVLDIAFAALPASGDGIRTSTFPTMEMCFVGNRTIHARRKYSLEEIAAFDLLTFQRGSQPHVGLLDLLRSKRIQPRKVHTISSISAMLQLVHGGFGVATLPKAAVERLSETRHIRPLVCTSALLPLPIHVSYRLDPVALTAEQLLAGAADYAGKKSSYRKNR